MRISQLSVLFYLAAFSVARHFDGGTIRWEPVDPSDTTSPITITVIQTYNWAYPTITCANSVPTSTSGRSGENYNLICMADCATDGNYSATPINILTDCRSYSESLGMLTSRRAKNISLTANAHFYLANVGSAWVPLNDPAQGGLEWSIVTLIDLRVRPDGLVNTPPVASVISPQYTVVNRTMQIQIPVSDANAGDTIRCRWSVITPGSRRRREGERLLSREKRKGECKKTCTKDCACTDSACIGTTCTGAKCTIKGKTGCPRTLAPGVTTTTDAIGTVKPTTSSPTRQAINECGDICRSTSLPSGTTLSNCIITFTGLIEDTWYGVAVQVEDFINSTTTTPMSSVPVQFLIYVQAEPICLTSPVMVPLNICREVQVGVPMSFDVAAINLCDLNVALLSDLILTTPIDGITASVLKNTTNNASLNYVTFTWLPQSNQIGLQQLCFVAYTEEALASNLYCATFRVKSTSDLCRTTTTTTTTTTSRTTSTSSTSSSSTSTSSTTSTSSSTSSTSSSSSTSTSTTSTTSTSTTSSSSTSSTSTSTTSTTSTTTTTSSSSSTTSSTSTSSTSSSTTSTTSTTTTTSTSSSTSSTTSSTSTSSSTTSTTSTTTTTSTSTTSTTTSTTTTTTSTTSTTTTTTTSTSTTTTSVTTTTLTTRTMTKPSTTSPHWLLILGLSLLGFLLAVCCFCCGLRWYLWNRAGKQRKSDLFQRVEPFNREKPVDVDLASLDGSNQTASAPSSSSMNLRNSADTLASKKMAGRSGKGPRDSIVRVQRIRRSDLSRPSNSADRTPRTRSAVVNVKKISRNEIHPSSISSVINN